MVYIHMVHIHMVHIYIYMYIYIYTYIYIHKQIHCWRTLDFLGGAGSPLLAAPEFLQGLEDAARELTALGQITGKTCGLKSMTHISSYMAPENPQMEVFIRKSSIMEDFPLPDLIAGGYKWGYFITEAF